LAETVSGQGPFFRHFRGFYEGLFGGGDGFVTNLGREGLEDPWGPLATPEFSLFRKEFGDITFDRWKKVYDWYSSYSKWNNYTTTTISLLGQIFTVPIREIKIDPSPYSRDDRHIFQYFQPQNNQQNPNGAQNSYSGMGSQLYTAMVLNPDGTNKGLLNTPPGAARGDIIRVRPNIYDRDISRLIKGQRAFLIKRIKKLFLGYDVQERRTYRAKYIRVFGVRVRWGSERIG
jgi:hypothetical protein